jgi:hypothetical protein
MSFVAEGKDSLFQEDLIEVMGQDRENEAIECFSCLDRDGNGDISLEEMILTVTQFGRERKSIATSMHDVDQAINALDGLLSTIVFIVCIFVFIAFLSPSFVGTLTTSATALLSLSFVFATTCQEVLGSCIFLFVKHPYDIGDRVDIGQDSLTVEHISLLYTVFKRVVNGKLVQIPNIVLNNLWVENVTRSKAMREQVSIFVSFDTTFEDITLLKQEMQHFVRDPQNNRDFFPDIEIEVVSIAEMNKLELRCEIQHKSNWSNETLRTARRSKFMCALVLALRKIPIYGPAGGDAALGDAGHPSWSVAISPAEAIAARDKFNAEKDAKRLFPTKKEEDGDNDDESKAKSTGNDYLNPETSAIHTLNSRKPGVDPVRDNTWVTRDDASTIGRPSTDIRPDLDEVRGLLHKVSSSGKRKQSGRAMLSAETQSMPAVSVPAASTPPYGGPYAPAPPSQTPISPSSISTGNVEEFQYQSMSPPGQGPSLTSQGYGGAGITPQRPTAPAQSPGGSNNPYRSPSLRSLAPGEKHPYKP